MSRYLIDHPSLITWASAKALIHRFQHETQKIAEVLVFSKAAAERLCEQDKIPTSSGVGHIYTAWPGRDVYITQFGPALEVFSDVPARLVDIQRQVITPPPARLKIDHPKQICPSSLELLFKAFDTRYGVKQTGVIVFSCEGVRAYVDTDPCAINAEKWRLLWKKIFDDQQINGWSIYVVKHGVAMELFKERPDGLSLEMAHVVSGPTHQVLGTSGNTHEAQTEGATLHRPDANVLSTSEGVTTPPPVITPPPRVPGDFLYHVDVDLSHIPVERRSDKFRMWKGRDVWHKTLEAQVRAEPNGNVFVCVSGGWQHPTAPAPQQCMMRFEDFHGLLKALIELHCATGEPADLVLALNALASLQREIGGSGTALAAVLTEARLRESAAKVPKAEGT